MVGSSHITQFIPLVDAVPAILGGRRRRQPRELLPDRGYDHDKYRRQHRALGITRRLARGGLPQGSGPGKKRWVVEHGFPWPLAFKRLRTRCERRADIHLEPLQLACALICDRQLPVVQKWQVKGTD